MRFVNATLWCAPLWAVAGSAAYFGAPDGAGWGYCGLLALFAFAGYVHRSDMAGQEAEERRHYARQLAAGMAGVGEWAEDFGLSPPAPLPTRTTRGGKRAG